MSEWVLGREKMKPQEALIKEGDYWPEPIRVVALKEIGDLVQIESRGVNKRVAYSTLLPLQELRQKVRVTRPSGVRFSGNPKHFQIVIIARSEGAFND